MNQERFFSIKDEMHQAFDSGNFDKAEQLAFEYLELAESRKANWNYGNAIHHSNIILGRIALNRGHVDQAKDFLIKAGESSGSPQLKSFGPNMMLAKELLEIGERDVVARYIDLTKKFWMWIYSWRKTRVWKEKILKGRIPDFGGNLI